MSNSTRKGWELSLGTKWVIACTAVGALLRVFRIGHQNLWIDEMISLEMASWAEGGEFFRGLLRDIHGPFTSLLLHGWLRLGESEAWMRLLYAIPSIATLPLAYRLGRDLAGERAGRVSCAVMALSPIHVWYAQEVRNYSWAMLFAAGALILFLPIWDGRARFRTYAGIAVCLSLGVLTNFSVGLLAAALTLLVAWKARRNPRRFFAWAGVLAFVALVFAPWFLDWYGRIGGERMFVEGASPTGMPLREASGFSLAAIPYSIWALSFGYSLGPTLLELHLDRSWRALSSHAPVLVLGAAAIGAGLLFGARELAGRGRLGLAAGLVAVPLALVVFLSVRDVKTFHPRYLLAIFPAFAAILGAGWSRPGRAPRLSAAAAGLLALFALGNHYFDPRYAKEDLRAAARTVLEREEPGDSVVVIYSYRPFQYYFQDRGHGGARLLRLHKRLLRTDDALREHAADAASGGGRVWLVLARWWDVAPEEKIRGAFEETLVERERWEHHGVKVTLYEGHAS